MNAKYDPELYDMVTAASVDGDVEWYLLLARESGGPVLELGSGTGRVLLPIARACVEIDGMDRDPGMLEVLRRKLAAEPESVRQRVRVVTGDMKDFRLDRRYALVQIPYRAFLHNLTRDDQLACLGCCREHLVDGGTIALNVFYPCLEIMGRSHGALEGVWRWTGEHAHVRGGVVVVSEATRYDPGRQRLFVRQKYEHFDADGHLVAASWFPLELAYLYPGDLRDLLAAAGFRDIRIDGGFDGRPVGSDRDELAVRARRC